MLVLLGSYGGGDATRIEGYRQSEMGWSPWSWTPTLSKLGRKCHHDRIYAREWPSPVYVLSIVCAEGGITGKTSKPLMEFFDLKGSVEETETLNA